VRLNIKVNLKVMVCILYVSHTEKDPVAGSCGYGNKP
jgi:hypothetical protein